MEMSDHEKRFIRRWCLPMISLSFLNWLIHLNGFSLFDVETWPGFNLLPIAVEIRQMREAGSLADFASSFAEFMLFIHLQFLATSAIIPLLILARFFVFCGFTSAPNIRNQTAFWATILIYIGVTYAWIFGGLSIFVDGGKLSHSYVAQTAQIAFIFCLTLGGVLMCAAQASFRLKLGSPIKKHFIFWRI